MAIFESEDDRPERRTWRRGLGHGPGAVAGVVAVVCLVLAGLQGLAAAAPAPAGAGSARARITSDLSRRGSPLAHATMSAGPLDTPGRVSQLPGEAGYAFTTPATMTFTTTLAVPTLNCSAVPSQYHAVQTGLQLTLELGGQYIVEQSWCIFGSQANQLNVDLTNQAYDPVGRGTSIGDSVTLSETITATELDATVSDANEDYSSSSVVPGDWGNGSGFIGTLDDEPENATVGGVPPYAPIGFTSTVDGEALGAWLTSTPGVTFGEQCSVFEATMEDQTSDLDGGDSFTVTYAELTLPTVSVSTVPAAGVDQPTKGTAKLTFSVSLSFASSHPVYLDYATADNTAVAGTNYDAASGTLAYPAGTTTKRVPVTILHGAETGGQLTFDLNISNPSYAYVPSNYSRAGVIFLGPVVLAVSPSPLPLEGGVQLTVSGADFGRAGSADTVQFCVAAIVGAQGCVSAPHAAVDSDNQITLVAPNAAHIAPRSPTEFPVDTIVTDHALVSSPVNEPGDEIEYGCDTTTVTDGLYDVNGCLTQEASGNDVAVATTGVDGLQVTGSTSDQVTYEDASAGGPVSSAGTSTVSLDLAGQLTRIFSGKLTQALSQPMTFAIPANTQVAGMKLSGNLTITPGSPGQATGSVTVTLPAIIGTAATGSDPGGATGTLTFTTTTAGGASVGGLSNLSIQVPSASFMNLFALSNVSLSFTSQTGIWMVSGTASTGGSQTSTFAGSITMTTAGKIKAASLDLGPLSLAGLLDVQTLSVKYAKGAWSGSATITQTTSTGKEKATVALAFNSSGLVSGELKTGPVSLFGVINLTSFDLKYATGEWSLALTSTLPGGGSTSASITDTNGTITAASLSVANVTFLKKLTITSASITYSLSGGNETWSGSWDVSLPGATVIGGTNGTLTFVNGSFQSGSIGITGNLPLVEGVFLTQLGVSLDLGPPMVVGGSASISFGPQVSGVSLAQLNGTLMRTFPTGTTVGKYDFGGTLMVLSTTLGSGSVTLPDTGATDVTLTLGGSAAGLTLGSVTIAGDLKGSFTSSSFNLTGKVSVTLPVAGTISANLVANGDGMAACATVSSGKVGFQYVWATDSLTFEDTAGCTEKGL